MKKWQKRFMALIVALGYSEQVKAGTLTADEQKLIFAKYEETHNITFEADRALDEPAEMEQTLLSAEDIASIATLLSVEPAKAPQTAPAAVQTLITTAQNQQQQIAALAAEPEPVQVPAVQASSAAGSSRMLATVLGKTAHTATHLFGLEAPMFARGKWYNETFITRKPHGENLSEGDKEMFITDFKAFAGTVRNRMASLDASNLLGALDYKQMIAGESGMDYSGLDDAGAPEYSVRRTDLILAYFRTIPSVASIFPVVSNIQNKEFAPTANFGELSQGYRSGDNFKGNVNFAAEVYSVIDLGFKFKFEDMIKLEKLYIGYLNREGSNPIKWTFIEWILVYFGQILLNEQNRRRVCGVRVPLQNVTSNPALLGADGALRAIERVEEDLKILPFSELGVYDHTSMLDVYETLWDNTNEVVPDMTGYQIYGNARHKQWYKRAYRAKYQLADDFTGSTGNALVDLSPDAIVWVPNMPMNCFKVWITLPNNVENYEDKPMEMLAFNYQQWMETLIAFSRWKEGSGVLRAGIKYKTMADQLAANREFQWIFTNFPASDLALADSISFKANTLFEITGNTPVTTVTNFSHEFVYKLVATDAFAGCKLAKAGAFSTINSDFVPAAAGDYIKVYAELHDVTETVNNESKTVTKPTGKFLELERKVTTV